MKEYTICMKAINNLHRPMCKIWKERGEETGEEILFNLECRYFNIGWKNVEFHILKEHTIEIKEKKKVKYEQLSLF